jgi:E3 ubiquitin-protein ligase UBR1
MTAQLFGTEHERSMPRLKEICGKFVFQDDIFLFFTDWLSLMAPTVAEASSILQLCFWAEMVKAIFVLRPVVAQRTDIKPKSESDNKKLARAINMMGLGFDGEDEQLKDRQIGLMRVLIEKYALTFLRKCTVLMMVRYGLEFECPYDLSPDGPELQRLTALLHMPTLDDILATYLSSSIPGLNIRFITRNWLEQAMFISDNDRLLAKLAPSINVPHPAIFELVGLPMNYDVLTEEAIRRRCPTTGKELTDPAMCLLCGDIFCSQAFCCMKDKTYGGIYQHMKKHGTQVGVFINIRKCMVVFSHRGQSGSWIQAPYLDKHGEPDPTLRRHHQLYLNQRRYDKLLRDVWLNHMIPSMISRKLEGDINTGGWETL